MPLRRRAACWELQPKVLSSSEESLPFTKMLEARGLVRMLAMINAVEKVNRSPLLADVNVTLGYHILDSCADVSTALRATAHFIERSHCPGTTSCGPPVLAVISYSSTAVTLSDKTRFPAFMRTIPNDRHQTAAMVSLLSTYGWTWVGVVTTDGNYGQSALENFVSQASKNGICVAFKSIIPQAVGSQDVRSAITQTARTIFENPEAQVIVSFAKPTLMVYLYQELKNQMLRGGRDRKSMRRVWVASDSWSSSSSVKENIHLEDMGHVLGFTFKSGDLSSFNEYLSRLEAAGHDDTGDNVFLQEFYTQLNASEGYGDTELVSKAVETLREHTHAGTIFSVEMAVSAIAQALVSVCRNRDCRTPGTVQPWELLKAMWMEEFKLRGKSFKFDSSGDINLGYDVTMWRSDGENIHVQDYHPHNNSFTHSTTQQLNALKHIISKCSKSCVPGESKKTTKGPHTCCYECAICSANYYSNDTGKTFPFTLTHLFTCTKSNRSYFTWDKHMAQCLSCDPVTEWSPEGTSSCLPKDRLLFSWQDPFAMVLLTFSALGVVLNLLVSALFLHQQDTPVVKAAGGPLSQVILFSLVISDISAMLFVGQPNSLQCKARQVLFGISFTLCVSCILVKTLHILLAFQFNPELHEPYIIVAICVSLQAATCICWLVLKSPYNHIVNNPTTLLEACHEGSYLAFGVMLGYIAVLAFVCFICAFKGRKLPHLYNEAKFITFSMLLYLISWLLFVPVYITTSGVYLPAVEMVVILISNYGILCCHFFPKCYIILFKKEQNTNTAFRKKLYEYSNKTTDVVSVSVVTNYREGVTCPSLHRGMMSKGSKGNGFSEANGTKVKVSAAREDKLIKSYSTSMPLAGVQLLGKKKDERCTVSLLDESAVRVDAAAALLGLLLPQPQDVLQTVQRHLHDLRVHHGEQVTHGFDGVQGHQREGKLSATQNNSPASEDRQVEQLYLDLSPVPCSDVGHGPARLLLDGLLGTAEQVEETRQS
ncbi:hypothetical protein F7725_018958 [Dissostichus mawsoni]|uniref:G-protein coupled receptor family C group 6 member A n=1 Tax=Dissostichus mawsoni TaxID=36200 RepID=A0A7J5XTN2_DISMA|nr:hypothetical protein F7725_018958 [Dissostichus mawsoni]